MIVNCKICGVQLERVRIVRKGAICLKCNLRRWKERNRDKVLSYHASEYQRAKERVVARINRWREKNAERWNAIRKADSHNRRVKTKYNCSPIATSELLELVRASNGKCFYCAENHNGRFHFDHYIPLSRGGEHKIENIRVACVSCNKHKGAKLPQDFFRVIVLYKSSLIDSEARRGNEAEGESHRERLNEKTPEMVMQQSELAA